MAPLCSYALALAMPLASMAAAVPTPAELETRGKLIIGGTEARAGEFPYIVSLTRSGGLSCGGVLLNANTVLTAAHCTVGVDVSKLKVRAGSLTWGSGGTQVGVSEVHYHAGYSSDTIDNDIGLWHLATPIPESSTIKYAILPEQGSDPAAASQATVAGWGYTDTSRPVIPSNLQKVTVPIVSRTRCREEYGETAITDNMICAGLEEGGKDSCSGDSGGPIIDAATGILVGLVSWGRGCAEAGYAGVYARVGSYVNYINEHKW